ncbi:DUF3942 family protein [Bacillus cereus group sp. MYBK108-2]|uniref:DUF3942 family protein n=1 Tax=unclassified Bacillus cereus group TaxID=2750818 RepID=UPI001298B40C|nr:DUF3942 domain-containing protein [Bacillus thuringiensis]HEF1898108.1 DUF3942 family protein [Bacillus cereus]
MSKLDETIGKLKAYIGEDPAEKVLREKYNELTPIFKRIDEQFAKPSEKEYLVIYSGENKYIKIESTKLQFSLNKKRNVIEVSKIWGTQITPLDEIILQDSELYCTKRGVNFTEDILNDYISETFVEILG